MSTGEVEFIEEPDRPPIDPVPAAAHSTTLLRAAAVVGWVAAAVLAVLAPFQAVYGSLNLPRRYADYVTSFPLGVDGWGRAPDGASGGVRFGIALVGCGGLFAVLAGVVAFGLVRHRAPSMTARRSLGAAVIGAPCLLAGVVVALGLYASAVSHGPGPVGWTIYAPNEPQPSAAYSSEFRFSLSSYPVGNCLWLALGALGSAMLATVAYLGAERADRRLAG
jgi:heme/copper-type cytochrome/quinol oxidase subunit 1